MRWLFDTYNNSALNGYRGQGNHQLAIADVDADGRDEIVFGAMTLNDNGTGLYTTGLGHGDALHVSDFDPDRPGLEVFGPHESPGSNGGVGASFRDAATGAGHLVHPRHRRRRARRDDGSRSHCPGC